MIEIPYAINKIFWGLLLVLLDINIIYFDILPDILGYIMIVSGLSGLKPYSLFFRKAKIAAVFLVILSVPAFFLIPAIPLDEFQPSSSSLITMASSTIFGLLHLVVIYYSIYGLIEMAKKLNIYELPERSQDRLNVYLIGSLGTMTVFPFVLNVSDQAAFYIIIISFIISITLEITILTLIRKYRKHFLYLEEQDKELLSVK